MKPYGQDILWAGVINAKWEETQALALIEKVEAGKDLSRTELNELAGYSEGDLTSDGFVVVEVLRAYCTGQSLTVINNCYIMFTGEGRVSVMIVDTSKGYQLLRLGAVSLLAFIQEKLPLTLREPLDDEKTFLTRPLPLTERIEAALVADDSLVVQHYPLSDMVVSQYRQELYSSWLFQELGNELIGFNVSNQEVFRFSQYYFLERLYTWLGIPFREEEFE